MLNECATYCAAFCLKFNVDKTKIMVFGKASTSVSSLACIVLHGKSIEYVSTCKYLGFHLVSSKLLKFSVQEDLCGFLGQ